MEKILVPTDFSPIADNAMQYAVELASNFESEILLFHAYSFNKKIHYNRNFPADQQPYVKQIEHQMLNTRKKFEEITAEKGISIITRVKEKSIFTLFNSSVNRNEISLIVMGTKGASGLVKMILGSVASTAIDMAEVPVLVVPPESSFSSLEHIVLAIDHRMVTEDVLSPLQKLANKFGAKVTVINVNNGDDHNNHPKILSSLEGVETTYKNVPFSKSINDSINAFIKKEGCDLLCMVRREKSFFESIFKKSITKTQVYNNSVPLLVLPE